MCGAVPRPRDKNRDRAIPRSGAIREFLFPQSTDLHGRVKRSFPCATRAGANRYASFEGLIERDHPCCAMIEQDAVPASSIVTVSAPAKGRGSRQHRGMSAMEGDPECRRTMPGPPHFTRSRLRLPVGTLKVAIEVESMLSHESGDLIVYGLPLFKMLSVEKIRHRPAFIVPVHHASYQALYEDVIGPFVDFPREYTGSMHYSLAIHAGFLIGINPLECDQAGNCAGSLGATEPDIRIR
jgi:hypothetical protein